MNDRYTADTINDDALDKLYDSLDGAYRERAHLVALLAAHYPSVIAPALDLDEAGWWIVYLRLDGRQASWHISPRDAGLFAYVERVAPDDRRAQWDGHTTEQKYQHIGALSARLYVEARGLVETPLTPSGEPVRQADADPDDPPVQCWHTEPGTPCDWDVCKQPERLAAGDYGTDPREQR
jgi:hypothetical protein